MKFSTSYKLMILASTVLVHGSAEESLTTFSDAEADAIIAQQVAAKAQREAEHLANTVAFQVLERREMSMGDRKLIACRIADPKLPKEEVLAPVISSGSAQAPQFTNYIPKESVTLMLSASVYNNSVTQLKWRHENIEYEVWSSIDWNFMRSVHSLKTDTMDYSIVQGVGDLPLADNEIPELPAFTPDRAEYFVFLEEGQELDDTAFAAIDALHQHYEANEEMLKTVYQRNAALAEAKKRHKAANPEKPGNAEIFFWKSETN
ncbi:MAG: hypothetical protein AAF065_06405 [Verrucomicrobiota bacterium]